MRKDTPSEGVMQAEVLRNEREGERDHMYHVGGEQRGEEGEVDSQIYLIWGPQLGSCRRKRGPGSPWASVGRAIPPRLQSSKFVA